METMRNCCQRNVDPAEAIAVLMEISDVSKRLACNLAKLADQENVKGGNENEQNVRIGCRSCRAAQVRRNPYRCIG